MESSSDQSIERVLRASRLLSALSDATRAEFARGAVRRSYERGDFVWKAGEPATHLTIIASGLIKICQPGHDGANAIVALFGPRESVGDIAVVSRGTYPADAVAASDALHVIRIEKTPVLAAMDRDIEVARALNQSLVDHSKALRQKIKIMTAGAVDQRLSALLTHLAERFGDQDAQGAITIPVVLSRTELACLVGSTVETTIRILSRWQKSGALSTTEEGFVIHKPSDLDVSPTE